MPLKDINKLSHLTVGLFSLLIVVAHGLIINRYAVDVPKADDYNAILEFLYRYKSAGSFGEKTDLIFAQHNEHRIMLGRLAVLADYAIFGEVNFRHLIFFGNLMLGGLFVVFYFFFREYVKMPAYYFLPVPLVIFNLCPIENYLWAMTGIAGIGVILFAFLSIYFLLTRADLPYNLKFALSIFFAFVATFTIGSGFLVLVTGLVALLFEKRYRHAMVWGAVSAGILWLYFKGYHAVEGHPDPWETLTRQPDQLIAHFFILLGNFSSFPWPFNKAIVLLSGFAVSLIILLGLKFLKPLYRAAPPAFYILVYVLVTCAMTSLSRGGFGSHQAFSSRYMIYSLLIVLILYFIFLILAGRETRKVKMVALVFLLICGLKYVESLLRYSGEAKASRKELLYGLASYYSHRPYTYLYHPDQVLASNILQQSLKTGIYTRQPQLRDIGNTNHDIELPKETNDVNFDWAMVPHDEFFFIENGWAHISGREYVNSETFVVLKSTDTTYVFDTYRHFRHDVTLAMNVGDLDNSGFTVIVPYDRIDDGEYEIGIYIRERTPFFSLPDGMEYTGKMLLKRNNRGFMVEKSSEKFVRRFRFLEARPEFYFDRFQRQRDSLSIRGWAFLEGVPSAAVSISLELVSDRDTVSLTPARELRNDVAIAYNGKYSDSGFAGAIDLKPLAKGDYDVNIVYTTFELERRVRAEQRLVVE